MIRSMSRTLLGPCLSLLLPFLAATSVAAQDGDTSDVGSTPETPVVDTAPLTGDVIVRFRGTSDPPAAVLDAIATDPAVEGWERLLGKWPMYVAKGATGVDPIELARLLSGRPDVVWADADRILKPEPTAEPPNDPMWEELWHLENTAFFSGARPQADANVRPAWDYTTGEGVIVAVLDSGIDMDHPDLRMVPQGYDAFDGDGIPEPDPEHDGEAHGTAVAGIASAWGDNGIGTAGVAYGAQTYGVRMLGVSGLTNGAMYNAFVAPVDAGAVVLNNSWGSIDDECSDVPNRPTLNEAVAYAREEGRNGLGTVVVFSAGNRGCEVTSYPLQEQPGVLSVGSLRDDDRKFPYSVWGPLLDIMAPSGRGSRQGLRTTDLVGEAGYNGRGENNEYTHVMSGTSGAAPVVSGVVALMIAANPRITWDDVERVVCETAVRTNPQEADYNEAGWSNTYGCGRIDAGAAVAAVANTAPGAPVFDYPEDGAEMVDGVAGLRWSTPEDPDGDPLRYDLEVVDLDADAGDDDDSADGDDDDSAGSDPLHTFYDLSDPRLDLTLELGPGRYRARVWAVDAWGRGDVSETHSFTIAAAEPPPPPTDPGDDDDEPDDGCGSSIVGGAGAGGLLLLPFAAARRRVSGRSRRSGTPRGRSGR